MSVTCLTLSFSKLLLPALWSLLVGVLPVVVKTNDGNQLEGNFDGFAANSLRLDEGGKIAEIAFDDLLSMRLAESDSRTGPACQVTLVGGSRIAAQGLSSTNSQLVIEPRRQASLTVPFKQVKAIRFRTASVATDPQWLGILEREQRGDSLVIRRAGERLDPQQGLVTGVTTDAVQFDLDGTPVNAPVDRLEGVVFGGNTIVESIASIQVTDIYGSTWSVLALEPSTGDQPLRMQLSNSLQHELPVDQIESIRWSGGIRMLADEKPAAANYQPFLATSIDTKLQQAFFGPVVDGDSDLTMHGGSSIEFRIEPGYLTVAGAVCRDEGVTEASSVTVQIKLDGKTAWEQTLTDAELRGFELPLEGARRLAIEVSGDGDGDLGDTVRIARPRLLK